MIQKIDTPVSVTLRFDHKRRVSYPLEIVWEGRDYRITKVGFHHTFREGRILYHIFSVSTSTLFFRLSLNTENLFWKVEEISDGLPN